MRSRAGSMQDDPETFCSAFESQNRFKKTMGGVRGAQEPHEKPRILLL